MSVWIGAVLNRKGEKFDWDNDDLTDLEVVDEQPKLIDPGVADIPVPDEYDEDITESEEKKERPSYVTRAVLARQRAGLDRESEPGAARGVGVLRADDVIVIDDDDDTVQGDYQSAFAPPLTIKVEEANIPVDSEVEQEGPRRSKRDRKQRVPFSPTVKGQFHKAVGFLEMEGSSGSDAPFSDDEFLSTGTEELNSTRTQGHEDYGIEYQGKPRGMSRCARNATKQCKIAL